MRADEARERPILFSAPMVRAILDGSKTQTRRVVKCPHKPWKGRVYDAAAWTVVPHSGGGWRAVQHDDLGRIIPEISGEGFPCPYGAPGDRLWVRETWGLWDTEPSDGPERATVFYRASDEHRHGLRHQLWRPSIHMPRWASRLTLTVTDVRVERLQDISEADAMAEGIDTYEGYARERYRDLWNVLNRSRGLGWDVNPWVWVLTFARAGA